MDERVLAVLDFHDGGYRERNAGFVGRGLAEAVDDDAFEANRRLVAAKIQLILIQTIVSKIRKSFHLKTRNIE